MSMTQGFILSFNPKIIYNRQYLFRFYDQGMEDEEKKREEEEKKFEPKTKKIVTDDGQKIKSRGRGPKKFIAALLDDSD